MDVRVGPLEAIPEREGRMWQVDGGRLVAIFHLPGGEVRATQPYCPHRGGPLADGLTGDGKLVCPLHSRTFVLDTGEATSDEVGLAVYPARVDGGTIVLSLPEGGALPCYSDADSPEASVPVASEEAPERIECAAGAGRE